jgi:hypothetical protein
VFVAHGDLTRLACDGVLVPTDFRLKVRDDWGRWVPNNKEIIWCDRVTERRRIKGQWVRYVDVGSAESVAEVAWLVEGVRQALTAATGDFDVQERGRYGRARPLIGMPVFGTGGGGYNPQRGAAIDAVLTEAGTAAKSGVDIALICWDRSDYTAVQSRRANSTWDLSASQRREADHLGELVRKDYAALFLGAGVSTPAGLAGWDQLLHDIAADLDGLPKRFDQTVQQDPSRAAMILQSKLGTDGFAEALRNRLTTTEHAIGHALLSSLQIAEAITTNVDNLYELAARVPFGRALRVIPWDREPGRPPWLLKMHGDLIKGHLVFTNEQYRRFERDQGPLGAVLQSLLVTRHLIFVGYSLRDEDFVRWARSVARVLRERGARYTEVGTVLALTPPPEPKEDWERDLRTVVIGDDDALNPSHARALEIFLDRVAWQAARTEASWLLDERYAALIEEDEERRLVAALRSLPVPKADRWEPLRQLLIRYGRSLAG